MTKLAKRRRHDNSTRMSFVQHLAAVLLGMASLVQATAVLLKVLL
jgi:hypothetical protein